MASVHETEDVTPSFFIGQHESKRLSIISPYVLQKAHESNYDMLTTPITNHHFHSRVLSLLSSHLTNSHPLSCDATGTMETTPNTKLLTVPPLSPDDTPLTPNDSISQIVGVTSSWVDLCSPDPLIADISRQVLLLEVAYAAFCGIGYLVIPGPRLHHGILHSEGVVCYARAIQDALSLGPFIQIHIWLKMIDSTEFDADEVGDLAPFSREEYLPSSDEQPSRVDAYGTWDAWDIVRTVCRYNARLFVALSLPRHLPSTSVQLRWHSEPVHLLTIDATPFIKNQKGYPVLSKAHQSLISRFMRLRTPPWILLCDVDPIPGVNIEDDADNARGTDRPPLDSSNYPTLAQAASHGKRYHDPTPHLSYIRNLQHRQPPRSAMERFGIGYQDYLQAPLQPLTVNLESITYEVFEKDPIKYEWYERAIGKALSDWLEQKKPTSGPDGRVVVAIVGAGRGPLVTRALEASRTTGVEIEAWAVEKNPNAFVLLQRHNQTTWGGKVNLVKSDMRSWKGPRRDSSLSPDQAPLGQTTGIDGSLLCSPSQLGAGEECSSSGVVDILVSELLGSFGDNELSPECLDGVTHLLNPEYGISIPASYSAHLTPISAPKLHADISAQKIANPAAPETPYVVMLHAIDYLSASQPTVSISSPPHITSGGGNSGSSGTRSLTSTPPLTLEMPSPIVQAAWSFSHPNPNIPIPAPGESVVSNAHNVRRTRLTFPCQHHGVCHGLGGYFETVLYRNIELSTNPVTMDIKSPGMISWFPIYFPLKSPLYIPDDAEVVVSMYRLTDDRKVWYEWMVEVFKLERNSISASTGYSTPVMSDARTTSPDAENGHGRAKQSQRKMFGRSGIRRVRVGISEVHSTIKDGCLM